MNFTPERAVTSAKIGGPSDSSITGNELAASVRRGAFAPGPQAQPASAAPPSSSKAIQRLLMNGPRSTGMAGRNNLQDGSRCLGGRQRNSRFLLANAPLQ